MLHKNHNYVIEASLFADNDVGVDVDRTDGVIVRNTVVIGESQSYRDLMARQDVDDVCSHGQLIGIDMHTWTLHDEYGGGARLDNISVSGFDESVACRFANSIRVDNHSLEDNQFEFYSSFSNIQLEDGADTISFCKADEGGINTVHFIDLDGSLSPDSVSPTGPSTLLGSSPEIQRFVDPAKCTDMAGRCYSYCSDTCFRSIKYETMSTDMDDWKLKACRKEDPFNCSIFQGARRSLGDPRTFIAHLPVGNTYNLMFVNELDQEVEATDGFVHIEYNLCPSSSGSFEVSFAGQPIPGLESVENPAPTASPIKSPTASPTASPTDFPTENPTESPGENSDDEDEPTDPSTDEDEPTDAPTETPTHAPTETPTDAPTETPNDSPTEEPIDEPTEATPTSAPTEPSDPTGEDDPATTQEEPSFWGFLFSWWADLINALLALLFGGSAGG